LKISEPFVHDAVEKIIEEGKAGKLFKKDIDSKAIILSNYLVPIC